MTADYKKMYLRLFDGASKALDTLEREQGSVLARTYLQSALLEAENIYIDTDDAAEEGYSQTT